MRLEGGYHPDVYEPERYPDSFHRASNPRITFEAFALGKISGHGGCNLAGAKKA